MSYLARFAVFVATVLCVSVLLTCLLVFPQMYVEINQLHRQVVSSVEEFKVKFKIFRELGNFLDF